MSSNQQKQAVGQGLKSLLKNIDAGLKNEHTQKNETNPFIQSHRIAINKINANPQQPRKDFDPTELQELADSIKIHDIIQPITVSKNPDDTYLLISGERRFRAAKMAGLLDIPAYVRTIKDKQNLVELALLENLQRTDLNAIEIALSYQQLINEFNLTHDSLAERMSKTRSTITNHLRLLKLPPAIQVAVRNNSISMGHARAISGLDNIDTQIFVFNKVVQENLSVRQTEDLAKSVNDKKTTSQSTKDETKNKKTLSPVFKKIEDKIGSLFNSKVELAHNDNTKKGSITIHYFNNDNLTEILSKMGINTD